jgi:hypothetical protein
MRIAPVPAFPVAVESSLKNMVGSRSVIPSTEHERLIIRMYVGWTLSTWEVAIPLVDCITWKQALVVLRADGVFLARRWRVSGGHLGVQMSCLLQGVAPGSEDQRRCGCGAPFPMQGGLGWWSGLRGHLARLPSLDRPLCHCRRGNVAARRPSKGNRGGSRTGCSLISWGPSWGSGHPCRSLSQQTSSWRLQHGLP